MPIIVYDDEPEKVNILGTTFYVRHLSGGKILEIEAEHTDAMGKLDIAAAQKARWAYVIAGWDDLRGSDGSKIEFAKCQRENLVGKVGHDLSLGVQTKLSQVATKTLSTQEEALKTSAPSSDRESRG